MDRTKSGSAENLLDVGERTQHTSGPWVLRRHENPKYPDLPTFDVLAPNPDAGKHGVCYSGEHFGVVQGMDSEADARLIAAAPELLHELKEFVSRWGNYPKPPTGADLKIYLDSARVEPISFRDASLALETVIPELFAEYWMELREQPRAAAA